MVRQDLERERGLAVSLRTIERAVAGWRRELRAEALATVRFETAPGHQLQIDFGEMRVLIGVEPVRIYLFVATLGYSRGSFPVTEWLCERALSLPIFPGLSADQLETVVTTIDEFFRRG